ncbi:hypothetical protein LEP1GSC059_4040 [Leptospira noguchii serovar Panama str. CZ214]|uniref:Uncharacterized protein n=1 Tax=Leptospira noguchii serovar Panama str. CZ214 TaxID=1001595 RepID=T0GXY2_9LEPT|nr:hypothetical protein LEP1GSC059_4040 [Leptospira noguchii serovar Panama str. CZ214]
MRTSRFLQSCPLIFGFILVRLSSKNQILRKNFKLLKKSNPNQ